MIYDLPLFRPPSEAKSVILQATIGCSHNKCTFCGSYKMKKFREKSLEEIRRDLLILKEFYPDARRMFIADGNAFCISTEKLLKIISMAKRAFPKLERISIYATPMDVLEKSDEEIAELANNGLKLIYLGVESGDDAVLKEVKKGATSREILKAGRKAIENGMMLSVTAILGLGGRKRSEEHAINTAKLLNEMKPHYTAFLTLIVVEGTPLHRKVLRGEFELLNKRELLLELRRIVEQLEYKTVFRANHASNYLPLKANLPEEKEKLLKQIDFALEHPEVLKPDYLRAL
ncbi:radical SAM protein [Ferroglobus sp.]|uniref:radical SAM protein n=1 Tax=Ferroglobus sp. TaxID=2614230 RepID=UPI0025BE13C8|nr:radical SAM protein [Ferroglobus sp.]